jgi:hypothetical protein
MKYYHYSNGESILKLSKNVIRHLRLNHDGVELSINDVGLIKAATKKDKVTLVQFLIKGWLTVELVDMNNIKFYDSSKNITMLYEKVSPGSKIITYSDSNF